MRMLVTGSRGWTDAGFIAEEMRLEWRRAQGDFWDTRRPTLVHGAARGADQIAAGLARSWGWRIEEHPAQWRPYGVYNPHAGRGRNERMVRLGADVCLAFILDGSRGATHCADLAEAAGIRVVRHRKNTLPEVG